MEGIELPMINPTFFFRYFKGRCHGNQFRGKITYTNFFSKWRAPPSWILNFVKFHWQTVSGRPRLIIVLNVVKISCYVVETLGIGVERVRISMPNFIKIGQYLRRYSDFIDFLRWRPPPSWIVEFTKFYWLTCLEGPDASLYQISSKSVVPLRRYCDFANFANIGFSKS